MKRAARAALYVRVSTGEQKPDNQLEPLRSFAAARGWAITEFVDHGVSGAKDSRPALDAMLAAVRTRKVDVVVVVKLDRLARSTRHLVTLVAEFEALKVDLVVLDQAIDTDDAGGPAPVSHARRDRGVRARSHPGKHLGRPRIHHVDVAQALALRAQGHSWRATARILGVHAMAVRRALAAA